MLPKPFTKLLFCFFFLLNRTAGFSQTIRPVFDDAVLLSTLMNKNYSQSYSRPDFYKSLRSDVETFYRTLEQYTSPEVKNLLTELSFSGNEAIYTKLDSSRTALAYIDKSADKDLSNNTLKSISEYELEINKDETLQILRRLDTLTGSSNALYSIIKRYEVYKIFREGKNLDILYTQKKLTWQFTPYQTKSLFTAGGSAAFTTIIDGLSRFMAQRFKDELLFNFVFHIQQELANNEDLAELKILFPQTCEYISKLEEVDFNTFPQNIKQYAEKDFTTLLINLPKIRETNRVQMFLENNSWLNYALEGLNTMHLLSLSDNPQEFIYQLSCSPLVTPAKSTSNSHDTIHGLANSLRLLHIISQGLTIREGSEFAYVHPSYYASYARDSNFFITHLALMGLLDGLQDTLMQITLNKPQIPQSKYKRSIKVQVRPTDTASLKNSTLLRITTNYCECYVSDKNCAALKKDCGLSPVKIKNRWYVSREDLLKSKCFTLMPCNSISDTIKTTDTIPGQTDSAGLSYTYFKIDTLKNTDTPFANYLLSFIQKDSIPDLRSQIQKLAELFNESSDIVNSIKRQKRKEGPAYQDIYDYYNKMLHVIDSGSDICAKTLGYNNSAVTRQIQQYIHVARKTGNIYKDLHEKRYIPALTSALNITFDIINQSLIAENHVPRRTFSVSDTILKRSYDDWKKASSNDSIVSLEATHKFIKIKKEIRDYYPHHQNNKFMQYISWVNPDLFYLYADFNKELKMLHIKKLVRKLSNLEHHKETSREEISSSGTTQSGANSDSLKYKKLNERIEKKIAHRYPKLFLTETNPAVIAIQKSRPAPKADSYIKVYKELENARTTFNPIKEKDSLDTFIKLFGSTLTNISTDSLYTPFIKSSYQNRFLQGIASGMKYVSFLSNVVFAENTKEVKDAIESVVLPPGSFRQKRMLPFSITLNGYVGYTGGIDFGFNTNNRLYGLGGHGIHVPIGFGFNWGRPTFYQKRRISSSFSLFIYPLDIGGPFLFRIKDSETQLPTLEPKNLITPGIQFQYGIPNLPLSLGAGFQWRFIHAAYDSPDAQINPDGRRIHGYYLHAGLYLDIPLFSFTNKPFLGKKNRLLR